MRKLIIKYGFGQYWYKYPWQKHYNNMHRGSFWYFNGYFLIGMLWMISGRPEWIIFWPTIIWTLVVLYLGFPVAGLGYFQKFPVKWDELDEEQKWYYGIGVSSGSLKKQILLTADQYEERIKIRTRMRKKYNLIDR